MKAKILLVEGKRSDRPSYVEGLTRKGYQVVCARNGTTALQMLDSANPDLIIIDAASMRSSGKRICQSLRSHGSCPIILVVENGEQESAERDGDANTVLALPFTLQKLVNRVRTLAPDESREVITAGPIQLDPVQRWVRVHQRQTSLTPRLVLLLRMLIAQRGQVILREDLFRQVWETEYTEDTRTLDVHISWLRRAIENDIRNPQFIKTIRRTGYRLDVE